MLIYLCKYQPAIKPAINAINTSKVLQNGISLINPKHATITITIIATVKYNLFLFVMILLLCKFLSVVIYYVT